MPDTLFQASALVALDRDDAGRQAAEDALRALNPTARIVAAESQRAAERGWSGPLPNLALVAFELEGQNGLEAAQRIRKISPETRVIVYSESIPEAVRNTLIELGCGFMNGPATAEKVLNALDCCAAERALASRACTRLAFA